MNKTIKLELNAIESGYLLATIYTKIKEKPEDKDLLENIYVKLKKECKKFYEETE